MATPGWPWRYSLFGRDPASQLFLIDKLIFPAVEQCNSEYKGDYAVTGVEVFTIESKKGLRWGPFNNLVILTHCLT